MRVFKDDFLECEVEVEFERFVTDLIALEPKLADSPIQHKEKNTFGDQLMVVVGVSQVNPLLHISKHLSLSIGVFLLDGALRLYAKITNSNYYYS